MRGEIEYLFKHILIHDVAYATIPRSIRRQRHRLVAEYIESAVQDRAVMATVLAHHWREAGESEKAIPHLMEAAEQALNAWALKEATELYDSALSLASDDEQRHRIRLARGLARSRLGDYAAAVDDLAELLPHLRVEPDRRRLTEERVGEEERGGERDDRGEEDRQREPLLYFSRQPRRHGSQLT